MSTWESPGAARGTPELTVYVDSSAFLTDFSANREIYLARMETAGLRFSSISFRLSKHKKHKKGTGSFLHKKSNHHAAPPELTDAERQEVANACSQLPASLRERVFRAMSASYRAQKATKQRHIANLLRPA